jgi:hypothetical protein
MLKTMSSWYLDNQKLQHSYSSNLKSSRNFHYSLNLIYCFLYLVNRFYEFGDLDNYY